jgi:hypothetical protein
MQLLQGRKVPVVCSFALGHAPDVLDGVELRRVGWQKKEFNFIAVQVHPFFHQLCVVIAGVVRDKIDFLVRVEADYPLQEPQICYSVEYFRNLEVEPRPELDADRAKRLYGAPTGFTFNGSSYPNSGPRGGSGSGLLKDAFVLEKNTRPPSLRARRRIAGYVFSCHFFCALGSARAS